MAELKKLFLETDVDKLIELVEKKKKISIKEAAVSLGEKEPVVEDWVKILEEKKYLKISYPIAGSPMIEMGEKKLSDAGPEDDDGFEEFEKVESKPAERETAAKQKRKKTKKKSVKKKKGGR